MKKIIPLLMTIICIFTLASCKHLENTESTSEEMIGVTSPDNTESIGTDDISVYEEVSEAKWDLIPMVMVDGTLYLDTGKTSDALRCGVMDGEITSTVEGWERPNQNDQSNFGAGYGYQYGAKDTVEIFMNDEWWIFATKEAKQDLQFSDPSENESEETP